MRRTMLKPVLALMLTVLTSSFVATAVATTADSMDQTKPSSEWLAWRLGREFGFAWAWNLMKESAQSDKSLGYARTYAKTLGISELPPLSDVEQVPMLGMKVQAQHGEKARYHFLAGHRMTYTWFGAVIGSDVKNHLATLAGLLERSGIPSSVWNTQLAAIQAKPSEAGIKQLADAIDEHLKR